MNRLVWLASYPKSGNTWLRCFLRAYQYDAFETVDINSIGRISKSACRLNYFRKVSGKSELTDREIDSLRGTVQAWLTKRVGYFQVVKTHNANTTHASYPLVHSEFTRKAIYIVRNPLEIVDSLADHLNLSHAQAVERMNDPEHTLGSTNSKFVTQYLRTWSEHVQSWANETRFEVLLLRYEDMLADPVTHFSRVVLFLDWYYEQDRVRRAVEFSSFARVRQKEELTGFKECSDVAKSGQFFRRGESNSWLRCLSDAAAKRVVNDHRDCMQALGYLPPSLDTSTCTWSDRILGTARDSEGQRMSVMS